MLNKLYSKLNVIEVSTFKLIQSNETINLIIKYDTINMSTIYLDGGNLNRSKI